MRDFEIAVKAVSDPTRTRILKLLQGGGLCVCQVQAVLGLAPSTVSKHLGILKLAGLVEDRRDGKWIEYALLRDSHNPHAARLLVLLRDELNRDPVVVADRKRLRDVTAIPRTELCSLAVSRIPRPPHSSRHDRARVERDHG